MLIAISGMVGSGKSTTAALVVELLSGAGLKPRYLRFRYLNLFGFDRKRSSGSTDSRPQAAATPASRGLGFSPRPLTAALTVGYVARILSFRLSGVGSASRCDVLDRYFYDNFVQYSLTSRRERLYAFVLKRLIPTADLAILLIASDHTIATRRSNYATEYVVAAGQRYRELPEMFPNLITIHTDSGSATEEIRRAVQALIDGRRRS